MKNIKSFVDFIGEGRIPIYLPGDDIKASKNVAIDRNMIPNIQKLVDAGKPVAAMVNTSLLKGANELKPEMDIVGTTEERITVRDYKGKTYDVKPYAIEEVRVGDSVEHNLVLNVSFLVDGEERMTVRDFDGKDVTVSSADGEKKIPIEKWKKTKKYEVD